MEDEIQNPNFIFFSNFLFSPLSLLCAILVLAIIVATVITNDQGRRSTGRCAACRHRQRMCGQYCLLAPFFPADRPQEFYNVNRVFGIANMERMLRELPLDQRQDLMTSIKYEANIRAQRPVHGFPSVIHQLSNSLRETNDELQRANQVLESVSAQNPYGIPSGGTPRNIFPINEGGGSSAFEFLTANSNAGARQDPDSNSSNDMMNQPGFVFPNVNEGGGNSAFDFLANQNTRARQDPDANVVSNAMIRAVSDIPSGGSSGNEFPMARDNTGTRQGLNLNVTSINDMIKQPTSEGPNEHGRSSGFEFPILFDKVRADQSPDANTITSSPINSLSNREADQDLDLN